MKNILFILCLAQLVGCQKIKAMLVDLTGHDAVAAEDSYKPQLSYTGKDKKRKKIAIGMREVATGLKLPTDMQFVPQEKELALVAEKEGALKWLNTNTGKHGTLLKINVETSSEQGLLGIAFHPSFASNRKVYLNYVVNEGGSDVTRVAEYKWRQKNKLGRGAFKRERTILDVDQPYGNHNAGQLAFGPDGYLYIGYGDGGWANDPDENGQDPKTLLGSMIRIDVNKKSRGKEYAVPKDNPFLGKKGFRPEVWAYGLRNPWRYSFDRDGNLIVGDVGQNKWEEITVVGKGENHGWNIMEADRCFGKDKCKKQGLVLPMVVYGRGDGGSVTGGYVYFGNAIKTLKGKYVFADFNTRRIWAVPRPNASNKHAATRRMTALGDWGIQIATFGQDASGEIYVADFYRGGIYKMIPGKKAE